MKNKTLSDVIRQERADQGEQLTAIFSVIQMAAKKIRDKLAQNGLIDEHGDSGETNVYGENVQKLDTFANEVLTTALLACPAVHAVGSEEMPQPHFADHEGAYIVTHDPLDGSSNIDTNLPIGTIFGIYPKHDSLLQKGSTLVASGYVLYGPSMMLVLALPGQVNGFTFHDDSDQFVLSYPQIRIGKEKIYSVNEGNWKRFSATDRAYITHLKEEGRYSLRYVGSMIGDVHRTLLKGGIFLYPGDEKNPHGKLRLLYEVAPVSFLLVQAGGAAFSSEGDPLDILPHRHDQRVPIVMGTAHEVELYRQFHSHDAHSSRS